MNKIIKTILLVGGSFLFSSVYAQDKTELNYGLTTANFEALTFSDIYQNISEAKPKENNVKDLISDVLHKGLEYLGTPYKWGGTNIAGFDCSGFVRFVYEHSVGFELPRTAKQMSAVGENIKNFKDLMPGDLVFFNTRKFNFSHVGIYLGDNKFIHAPRKGSKVQVDTIDQAYWVKRFNGGRRVM